MSSIHSVSNKPKIIVVCGPTGIGKTAVGIKLAERLGSEIISADSMQIYRRLDIGTAKPTPAEQAQIVHHMIDIVEPDEDYDAVQFSKQAGERIAEIASRGLKPFIVGGTGLYIKGLIHGLFQTKPVDPKLRNRLKQELAQVGSSGLHRRLAQIDPNAAGRLHPNDSYRIIRALETIESSGKSISEHHQRHGFENERFNAFKIGLRIDREKLYERIDQRVDLMIETGLVEEVKKLLSMGYPAELKSMQSIGYRHVVGFLNGNLTWAECLRTLKRDTRRFAKRQFTWFGADPQIKWYQPEQLDQIFDAVERFLE